MKAKPGTRRWRRNFIEAALMSEAFRAEMKQSLAEAKEVAAVAWKNLAHLDVKQRRKITWTAEFIAENEAIIRMAEKFLREKQLEKAAKENAQKIDEGQRQERQK